MDKRDGTLQTILYLSNRYHLNQVAATCVKTGSGKFLLRSFRFIMFCSDLLLDDFTDIISWHWDTGIMRLTDSH